jgi:molybdopterin-guanine dinucleotide biosynthesis protein A
MKSNLKIAGIVLAGGLSSRMGENKANLQIGNISLLDKMVNLLNSLSFSDVFISGDYPKYQSIPDTHEKLGPLGGFFSCDKVLGAEYDAMFVVPVDMPLLTVTECFYLLEQFKKQPQGVYFTDAIFPLILPLTDQLTEYLSDVLTSPQNKKRSLYRLFKTLKLTGIEPPKDKLFRFKNSNTRKQWEECLALYSLDKQNIKENK